MTSTSSTTITLFHTLEDVYGQGHRKAKCYDHDERIGTEGGDKEEEEEEGGEEEEASV